MSVSVLLSAYNGEKYIIEQLDSLVNQTRAPDEVVIIDDLSTDDTRKIVQHYINKQKTEIQWKFYKNDSNNGWRTNFIKGIDKISGDYLFFCDQDDIWFDNKIETYCELLKKNETINVLVSKETLWEAGDIRPKCHIENSSYVLLDLAKNSNKYLIHSSGCCMAVRLNYIKKVIGYYINGWAHDDFFWKMGILDGSLAYMQSSTILHRVTGSNQSRKKIDRERMIAGSKLDINVALKLMERLEIESNQIFNKEIKKEILQHKEEGAILRKKMIDTKCPFDIVKILFKYPDIYRKKRQILGDYLRTIGII